MINGKKDEITGVTKGTDHIGEDYMNSLEEIKKGIEGTIENKKSKLFVLDPVNPIDQSEVLIEPDMERPCYMVYENWFTIHGQKKLPGLYWHGFTGGQKPEPIDVWVCSTIHADAVTANERDESFGLLLRFLNPFNKWREWAMPMHLLKGNGDEMRGELLYLGLKINLDAKKHLNAWLMQQKPKRRITAAMHTGWHSDGKAFVLPNKTIGDSHIRFQSESTAHVDFIQKGDLHSWREAIANKCSGNPILLLSVGAAFAAPLLLKAKQQFVGGSGIHLVGKSSCGKTTALHIAASVWGDPSYVRTWRATANGLEATAAALNDSLLVLDEISECESREIGSIVYALANGHGKQRAQRSGGPRESSRWRTLVLSSGERTLLAHMQESGIQIKAGQEARLLSLPATDRLHGAFDNLHGLINGRAFADLMKQETSRYYGVAGQAFIEKLLEDQDNFLELYAQIYQLPDFSISDGVESRAAGIFALIGMAGEKATEYGLTGWAKNEALNAAVELFNTWRDFRGQGQTEARQILQGISNFIDRHGDSRFSEIGEKYVFRDRAGYWKDTNNGRIFMFYSVALQEAAKAYDLKFILRVLKDNKWIVDHDINRSSKKTRINGRSVSLYWIQTMNKEL